MTNTIINQSNDEFYESLQNIELVKIFYFQGSVDRNSNIIVKNDSEINYHSFYVKYENNFFFIPCNTFFEIDDRTKTKKGIKDNYYNFFNSILRFNNYNPIIIDLFCLHHFDLKAGSKDQSINYSYQNEFIITIKELILSQFVEFKKDFKLHYKKFCHIDIMRGWQNGMFAYSDDDNSKKVFFQRVDNDVFAFRPMVNNYLNYSGSFLIWQQAIKKLAISSPLVYFGVALGLLPLYKDLLINGFHCSVNILNHGVKREQLELLPYIISSVSSSPEASLNYYDTRVKQYLKISENDSILSIKDALKTEILHLYKFRCITGVGRYKSKDNMNYLKNFVTLSNNEQERLISFICNVAKDGDYTKEAPKDDLSDKRLYNRFYKYSDVDSAVVLRMNINTFELPKVTKDFTLFSLKKNYGHLYHKMSLVNKECIEQSYIHNLKIFDYFCNQCGVHTPQKDYGYEHSILNFFVLLASILEVANTHGYIDLPIEIRSLSTENSFIHLFFCFYLRFYVNYKELVANTEIMINRIIDTKLLLLFKQPVSYLYTLILELVNSTFIDKQHIEQSIEKKVTCDLRTNKLVDEKQLIFHSSLPLQNVDDFLYSVHFDIYGIIIFRNEYYFTQQALEYYFNDYDIEEIEDELDNRLNFFKIKKVDLEIIYRQDIKLYTLDTNGFEQIKIQLYKFDENALNVEILKLHDYGKVSGIDFKYKYLYQYTLKAFSSWNLEMLNLNNLHTDENNLE